MPNVVAVSSTNEGASKVHSDDEQPKKLKPCCACPETKRVRDQCIIEKGAENCGSLIEEHKECMKKLGFNI